MISLGHYFLYLVLQPRGVSAANFLFNLKSMVISYVQETCFEVQPRIIDILTLTEVVPGDRWQICIKRCSTILAVVSAFYRSWFKLQRVQLSNKSHHVMITECWLDHLDWRNILWLRSTDNVNKSLGFPCDSCRLINNLCHVHALKNALELLCFSLTPRTRWKITI